MKASINTLYMLIIICMTSCVSEIIIVDESKDIKLSDSIKTKSEGAGSVYYWSSGRQIPLSIVPDKYYVLFEDYENDEVLLTNVALSNHNNHFESKSSENCDDHSGVINYAYVDSVTLSSYNESIYYSAPVLSDGWNEYGLTHIFYLKLFSESDKKLLYDFVAQHKLNIISEDFLPLWYSLSCTDASSGNALELANIAYESGKFAASDVQLLGDVSADATYNDTYYPLMWNLFDNYGINMGVIHDLTTGTRNVKIAVIDSGVQLNHPDLDIEVSWDAVSRSSPARLYYDYNAGSISHHGTSMAGIIGASINNGLGIIGIAPETQILPISVNFNSVTVEILARAIRFAADYGAQILSNSWTSDTSHDVLNAAFDYALREGCIIVQSSGNNSSMTPRFPYANFPEVVVVGNSDIYGVRNNSSSNYGEHIDIVAPGTSIQTLDALSGYRSSTGTSPACAHVSAILGLMLSVNPNLSRLQATNILETTARKLPSYVYNTVSGRLNGLWNNEVGYGLVNCYDAVYQAAYLYKHDINNYTKLIEFDYSEKDIEIKLTTTEDIVIIWDLAQDHMSSIMASSSISPVDTTITHSFPSSNNRHIIIAKSNSPWESLQSTSSALTSFELVTGEHASDIEIYPINESLKYIRVVGGDSFKTQLVNISNLSALEELYLVKLKGAEVRVSNCPILEKFGTSMRIWQPIEPIWPNTDSSIYAVGDPINPIVGWPLTPETIISPSSISINDCPGIKMLSFENVGFDTFDFSTLQSLEYVYLSSDDFNIVGAKVNSSNIETKGGYLSAAISSLPIRTETSPGEIMIRSVNTFSTAFVPVNISTSNYNSIMTSATTKEWIIDWRSGVEYE